MDVQKAIDYWLENALDAQDTADTLFENQKYHHALFFGQLALESVIKAYVLFATKDHALPIHDLVKLLRKTELTLSEEQKQELNEISAFNLEARYPKDKQLLFQKASREFTQTWLAKIKEYCAWFTQTLIQK